MDLADWEPFQDMQIWVLVAWEKGACTFNKQRDLSKSHPCPSVQTPRLWWGNDYTRRGRHAGIELSLFRPAAASKPATFEAEADSNQRCHPKHWPFESFHSAPARPSGCQPGGDKKGKRMHPVQVWDIPEIFWGVCHCTSQTQGVFLSFREGWRLFSFPSSFAALLWGTSIISKLGMGFQRPAEAKVLNLATGRPWTWGRKDFWLQEESHRKLL